MSAKVHGRKSPNGRYSEPDERTPWQLQKKRRLSEASKQEIKDYLAVLRRVEKEVARLDPYVDYCVNKYRPFMFNIQQFLTDELIASSKFAEFYEVKTGPYKGKIFWGQHLDIDKKFEPHGFGILIDQELKVMQLGTFKQGKECG